MFIWRLICTSRWPKQRMRWFFLFLLAIFLTNMVIFHIFDIFDFVLWRAVTIFGELVLALIVDRTVHFILFKELWEKLTPLRALYKSDLNSREQVHSLLDTCTFLYLEAMAWRIKRLTEEQRVIAVEARDFPGFCTAKQMIINDLVAKALKDFWRVHWLARSLGVDVYTSWKHYVMPEGAD